MISSVRPIPSILVQIALFAFLSRQGLGTRNEGLWRQRNSSFPVLGSRTSGLHVCSRDVSIYYMEESCRLLLPLKISLFQTTNKKKIELIKKSHVSRVLSFFVPRHCRQRGAKRAMGTRMNSIRLRCSRSKTKTKTFRRAALFQRSTLHLG